MWASCLVVVGLGLVRCGFDEWFSGVVCGLENDVIALPTVEG